MTSNPVRRNGFYACPIALILVAGLLLGGLVGCTPEVQTTVWKGLNDLSVSMVNALFQALNPVTTDTTPTPVTVGMLNGSTASCWA
jgi:hypothetical protein